MLKYKQMVDLLSSRITSGAYPGGKLPAVRQLAEEIGVSYLTARKAVKELKRSGLISRDESNRKILIKDKNSIRPRVCLISSLWIFTDWHRMLRDATQECGGQIHFVTYGSDTDPVITEMLGHDFDVIFIMLPVNRTNQRLLARLQKLEKRIVVLFNDLSEMGIRCLLGPNPDCISNIILKLRDNGCNRIDAISTGDRFSSDIEKRLSSWQKILVQNNLTGVSHLPSIEPFSRVEIDIYHYCREQLDARNLPDAIYCLTPPVALGLYRYCADLGIQVGKDIKIFSFGDAAFCEIMTPRLATVNTMPGIPSLIRELLSQYLPDHEPDERLVFQSTEYEIKLGESLHIEE